MGGRVKIIMHSGKCYFARWRAIFQAIAIDE